jgi:CO/xanthine dehydrogenase FAD-binding subunit
MDLAHVDSIARPTDEAEIPPFEPGDAYIAGGTWLFSEPQPTVRRLIDLSALPWRPVSLVGSEADGELVLSATCTYQTLEKHAADLGTTASLFHDAIRSLSSSFKTYGLATVGGNICLAYPKSMMAPVMVALDAFYELQEPGGEGRTLPAADFQIGAQRTARRDGEYLRAIRIPRRALSDRFALERFGFTRTSHATAMAIARRNATALWLTLSAALEYPVRIELSPREEMGDNAQPREEIEGRVREVCTEHPMLDDAHGSAAYRCDMLVALAERAVQRMGKTV